MEKSNPEETDDTVEDGTASDGDVKKPQTKSEDTRLPESKPTDRASVLTPPPQPQSSSVPPPPPPQTPPPPPPPQYQQYNRSQPSYYPNYWQPPYWWWFQPPPYYNPNPEYSWENIHYQHFFQWKQRVDTMKRLKGHTQAFRNIKVMLIFTLLANIMLASGLFMTPFLSTGDMVTMKGRVVDIENKPISNVTIELSDGSKAVTNASGYFSMANVSSGAVFARVIPPNSTYRESDFSALVDSSDTQIIQLEKKNENYGITNNNLALPIAAGLTILLFIFVDIHALRLIERKRGYAYSLSAGITMFISVLLFVLSLQGSLLFVFRETPISFVGLLIGLIISVILTIATISYSEYFMLYAED